MDRIISFKNAGIAFIKNTEINFEDCFKDVIGVTVPNKKVIPVVLHFNKERLPYVISQPLQPSQVVNEKEQTVTIQVKPNKELDQMIFSFIPDIEVVSPLFLREQIQKKIEENLQKYLFVQKDSTAE